MRAPREMKRRRCSGRYHIDLLTAVLVQLRSFLFRASRLNWQPHLLAARGVAMRFRKGQRDTKNRAATGLVLRNYLTNVGLDDGANDG